MVVIKDLDLASAIIVASGQRPALNDPRELGLTGFSFPDTDAVKQAVVCYTTGELVLPARRLLKVRGDLFRQLRRKK